MTSREVGFVSLITFSTGSSQPRSGTEVSGIAGRFFIIWAIREGLPCYQQVWNSPRTLTWLARPSLPKHSGLSSSPPSRPPAFSAWHSLGLNTLISEAGAWSTRRCWTGIERRCWRALLGEQGKHLWWRENKGSRGWEDGKKPSFRRQRREKIEMVGAYKERKRKESQKKGEKDEVWWRVKEEASWQGRVAELCPGTSWSPSPWKKGEESLDRDNFIQPPVCEMGRRRAVYPGMSAGWWVLSPAQRGRDQTRNKAGMREALAWAGVGWTLGGGRGINIEQDTHRAR